LVPMEDTGGINPFYTIKSYFPTLTLKTNVRSCFFMLNIETPSVVEPHILEKYSKE
jgi:hypothetical protein